VGLRAGRFLKDTRRFSCLGFDSSLLIYHLEDAGPYSDLTEIAFSAVASGTASAVLSTTSVTELLVKPMAEGREDAIKGFEKFVLSLPNTTIVPPDFEIAKEAARLRASYRIRTPDAILLATARIHEAGAFLTNDDRLKRIEAEGITVLVLDDYL
jgi:predicted nucleic acid-binding protein